MNQKEKPSELKEKKRSLMEENTKTMLLSIDGHKTEIAYCDIPPDPQQDPKSTELVLFPGAPWRMKFSEKMAECFHSNRYRFLTFDHPSYGPEKPEIIRPKVLKAFLEGVEPELKAPIFMAHSLGNEDLIRLLMSGERFNCQGLIFLNPIINNTITGHIVNVMRSMFVLFSEKEKTEEKKFYKKMFEAFKDKGIESIKDFLYAAKASLEEIYPYDLGVPFSIIQNMDDTLAPYKALPDIPCRTVILEGGNHPSVFINDQHMDSVSETVRELETTSSIGKKPSLISLFHNKSKKLSPEKKEASVSIDSAMGEIERENQDRRQNQENRETIRKLSDELVKYSLAEILSNVNWFPQMSYLDFNEDFPIVIELRNKFNSLGLNLRELLDQSNMNLDPDFLKYIIIQTGENKNLGTLEDIFWDDGFYSAMILNLYASISFFEEGYCFKLLGFENFGVEFYIEDIDQDEDKFFEKIDIASKAILSAIYRKIIDDDDPLGIKNELEVKFKAEKLPELLNVESLKRNIDDLLKQLEELEKKIAPINRNDNKKKTGPEEKKVSLSA
ncbi:MAG: hypothetical protein GF347_01550 [Candidatus Moranbacteria bacterium]|nr:hypothetical protein [Candidatus Moranbacteria bacterium]